MSHDSACETQPDGHFSEVVLRMGLLPSNQPTKLENFQTLDILRFRCLSALHDLILRNGLKQIEQQRSSSTSSTKS